MLGGGLVGAGVAGIAVGLISGLEVTLSSFVWTFVGQAVGSVSVMAYLSRTRGTGSPATDFGLELRIRHWWGIPAGVALQYAAAFLALPLIDLLFPDGAPEQTIAGIAEGAETAVDVILIITAVVVLAPVVEEIIFRGMLLSRLLRSMSKWWAILAQAAVFAAIHLLDPSAIAALPGLFLIGTVLGYAAIKSGSLSLPIFLHAGVNLTAAVVLIFGLDDLTWLEPGESLLRMAF